MPISSLSDPVDTDLTRLAQVAAGHPAVRRYSRVRRNLLPRDDLVTTIAGAWAHETALRADAVFETVLWCPGEHGDGALTAAASAAAARSGEAWRISPRSLARIHPGISSPALVSVVRLPRWDPADAFTGEARLLLVADGIEYAGNLGTLVRTADACAADGVVLTSPAARVTHPKTFVASRGTVLTMPVLEYPSVSLARDDLAAAGFTAYVADPAGATSYRAAGLGDGRTAVVVGSEGQGVCPEWRDGPTRVSIPMHGRADSLNVATSAAVLLFEARAALDRG
jgi:tRNA G18 (ribose-2'-O)-methylase SpoU